MCGVAVKWRYSSEVIVSYLPLSHVAAQIVDIYVPMLYAASVYFAQPDALKVFQNLSYRSSVSVVLPAGVVTGDQSDYSLRSGS